MNAESAYALVVPYIAMAKMLARVEKLLKEKKKAKSWHKKQ